ncbi:MAG: Ferrous iron transport protein A [Firmicutes bacterium]|nr:Ferrous iron transport protein A [Bacillota bacterium]MDI6706930.1 ferrous iron transport protein A [Bacillota bacterium]
MRTLKDVKPGETVTVIDIKGGGMVKSRLMAMGVIKGSKIAVEKVAPLGDPIDVRVRGYHLSFRKSEAELISVS